MLSLWNWIQHRLTIDSFEQRYLDRTEKAAESAVRYEERKLIQDIKHKKFRSERWLLCHGDTTLSISHYWNDGRESA